MKPTIKLFDWRAQWQNVLPIIRDRNVRRTLHREMRQFIDNTSTEGGRAILLERWRRTHAPWELSRGDGHYTRIDNLVDDDPEWQAWCAAHPFDGDLPIGSEDEAVFFAERDRIAERHTPNARTLEFYQAFSACHWVCNFQRRIARALFPGEHVQIVRTEKHSWVQIQRADHVLVFDILLGSDVPYPYLELIEQENTRHEETTQA
jgi:hypothetical protein